MRFRGENPVYKYGNYDQTYDDTNSATYGGVTTKTAIVLAIIGIVALGFANSLSFETIGANVIAPLIIAPIIAIIAVIATHRLPHFAFVTSVVYAVCEGVFLGFISALVAYFFGGELVQMALVGTFGVLAGMLFLYVTGIIRVGSFFRKFMFSMVIGLVISSILFFIVSMVSSTGFEGLYSLYVGIVVVSVIISSLYLLVDFDRISHYVQSDAPKEYEWSLALGLAVTIVWVYIELLRLIVILSNRRN
jgi:uncharacterized YccA/Bax inhibitor family protein